jgi:thiaminase
MTTINDLRNTLEAKLEGVDERMRNFLWGDPERYAAWLSQTYYYVSQSTRLFCMSGSRLTFQDNQFHLLGIDHMKEEKAHELLVLKDLRELGYDIGAYKELPVTEALYKTVSHSILNQDPLAIYGYILCLEGISMRSAKYCALAVRRSYSNKKVDLFLDIHSNEDCKQVEKTLDLLSDLPSHRLEIIERMMNTCFYFYEEILRLCYKTKATEADLSQQPLSAFR